jgi:enoyl-CoA hydratase/carnithine racemase
MGTEPEAMISVEVRGQVAVVQMRHGKANALDTALCRSLTAEFGGLAGRGCRAAVLTGHGSIFSAGADLLRLRDGGPGYLDEFLPALSEAFLAVFDCPVPVVAAVNGHAIAGGCVLACACDYRVMNEGHGRHRIAGGRPVPGYRAGDHALRRGNPPAERTRLLRPDLPSCRGGGFWPGR